MTGVVGKNPKKRPGFGGGGGYQMSIFRIPKGIERQNYYLGTSCSAITRWWFADKRPDILPFSHVETRRLLCGA